MSKGPIFRQTYEVVLKDIESRLADVRKKMDSDRLKCRNEEYDAKDRLREKVRERLKSVQEEIDELAKGLGLFRSSGVLGVEAPSFVDDVYSFRKRGELYEREVAFSRAVEREATKAVLRIMGDPESFNSCVSDAVDAVMKEFEC